MLYMLGSTLIPARANRFPSRSPPSSRTQRKLYFPPGGHTHDRHTIPPDRLHISFSDPVLVAAEQRLSSVPNAQRRSRPLNIKDAGARKTAKPGSIAFHLKKGEILSQRSGNYNDSPLVPEAVNPPATVPNTPATSKGHCWKAGFQAAAAHLLDPPDDSCDISEVVTIMSTIDGSPGNAHSSASENRRCDSDLDHLAPLASETFKEELYIRGYLERPASRPSNVVPRKPRTSFMFVSRKILPKVLGRRQGRKVAECLRAVKATPETPGGLDAYFAEKQSSTCVASVTFRTLHADGLESPGVDTNTSPSESFDLHEFSYITAFTTPPSSPSIILDAETFKKGVDLADSKHAS